MTKFVYRYRDINRVGDGASQLYVERRIVVKETPCFVYHIPLPYGWVEGEELNERTVAFSLKTKGFFRARRTRKGAHRSSWRLDKKVAMADWVSRKAYQLSRLRLTIERVESLLDTCVREGVIVPQAGNLSPLDRVVLWPDVVDGPVTPEASEYNWQEY